MLPSNCSIIVDRVPIEYADYSYKPAESVIPKAVFFNQAPQHRKRSNEDRLRMDKKGGGDKDRPDDKKRFQGKYTMEELNAMFDNARFFIMRSSNADNINTARAYKEWATTIPNEHKLKEAYKSGKYVFLIYAVSKSYEFQGFARMAGQVTGNMRLWRNDSNIKLGGSFKLEWISDIPLSFNKILNMTNPLNDNDYVRKSKDGTEIEPSVGKELCLMFNINYKPESGEMNIPKLPGYDKGHTSAQMSKLLKIIHNKNGLQNKESLEEDAREQLVKYARTNDLPGMMEMIKMYKNLQHGKAKKGGTPSQPDPPKSRSVASKEKTRHKKKRIRKKEKKNKKKKKHKKSRQN